MNERQRFQTTQWSLVLAAGDRQSPAGQEALAQLCQRYWFPLYAFVRVRVSDVHEAQDLTQAFFAQILDKDSIRAADPERGKFRSFLLSSLRNFLNNQWDWKNAQKRGGGHQIISIDFAEGERRLAEDPAEIGYPEQTYQRKWAVELLAKVMSDLESEFATSDRSKTYRSLKPFLSQTGTGEDYERIGKQLGSTPGAIKVAVHRMRRRFGELLRKEIESTLSSPDDVEGEIQELFAAVAN